MPTGKRAYDLEEVTVANHDELQPATVDHATLTDQSEERRIDQELLISVRLCLTRARQSETRTQDEFPVAVDRYITDLRREREDRFNELIL